MSQGARMAPRPRQQMVLVQRADAFLTGADRDSFFTAEAAGSHRFVGAGQIVVTEMRNVEVSVRSRTRQVSGARLFLDRSQCSRVQRTRETFLVTAAAARM